MSTAMVSGSLRDDPCIPMATKVRILSLATQEGYRPKRRRKNHQIISRHGSLAVSPRSSEKSLMLAAFVAADDIQACENAYQSLAGMAETAHANEVSLLFHSVPLNKREIHLKENQPELMRKGKLDGVVLLNLFQREYVAELVKQVVCVSVDVRYDSLPIDCVGEENIESIGKAVAHLYALGHRKIGYVDETYDFSVLKERLAGYLQKSLELGLAIDLRYILSVGERQAAADHFGLDRLHRWIEDGVTALVCAGDGVAIEVFRWLRDHGYRCPEQVSITGFDAVALPHDVPPLTTLRVHFQDLGRLAVERLLSRCRESVLPLAYTLVGCELIVGKTTAPPWFCSGA